MELVNGLTSKKKECLSDKIHDKILEMIIKNPPGEEQVLTEGKLVELFGVSKAPVREALIKLCSEGIVRSVPRYGYVVLHMTEKEAEEVIGLRRLLEKEALKSSFFKLTEENLSSLKDQIDKTVSQNDISLWDVWDDNAEFHLMLASFSQNYILIKFLRECMDMEKRVYAQRIWNSRSSMDAPADGVSHMGIYQKLLEKDLDGAMILLDQDIQNI